MFGRQADAAPAAKTHGQSILQEGVSIGGEFEAKGDVRLDGKLKGKMRVTDRLTVGPSGEVEADLEAGEVIIMGQFKGTIHALRRLELRKGAKVVADISTASLIIEEGVFFQGRSSMASPERKEAPAAQSVQKVRHETPSKPLEKVEEMKEVVR